MSNRWKIEDSNDRLINIFCEYWLRFALQIDKHISALIFRSDWYVLASTLTLDRLTLTLPL
ncbi:hypothetical protein RhiirA5_411743 [Rhizophagus irregularis]|uniref:Uncharacterized protein n=1 Tax=Rhizophagus irregularis TaxID=588596 RepID=A0A2I1EZC9_9GLOM|nr:hypothetical protein RhiirA5_411743 [Rhizophagus irregularis]PKY27474.1 hypothetical protein RhiirB3_443217 [Rhizophagus irregularis]